MTRTLTAVMYHYVRDPARSRYPKLNVLDVRRFRAQLDWARRHHTIVRMEQVVDALAGGEPLPPHALLLTFDDGYADHYEVAFPILDDLGLQGSFFPSTRSALHRGVLVPNKVHLILASVDDPAVLARTVADWVDANAARYGLEPSATYYARHATRTRYDGIAVGFVKRMLQHALPDAPRAALLDALFDRFVGVAEATIAEELYASEDQLRLMLRHGMHLGGHGVEHRWLTTLGRTELSAELDGSRDLLARLGVDRRPRGPSPTPTATSTTAVAGALAARGCGAAFTIEPGVVAARPRIGACGCLASTRTTFHRPADG